MASPRLALTVTAGALAAWQIVRMVTSKSPIEIFFGAKTKDSRTKVYFAASIRGGREDVALYQKIIAHLAKTTQVLTEHIGQAGLESMGEAGRTDEQIYDRDI